MKLSHVLPEPIRGRVRPIWWGYLRWPKPFWRTFGYGTFELAGQRFRFYDVAEPVHQWWAWRAHEGAWEPEVLRFFADSLQPGDVVLDIGAYTGPYSLLASRLVGGEGVVYAFEPDPIARKLLERNLAANGAQNVRVLPIAITDHEGVVTLATDSALGDATTAIDATGQGEGIEVEAMTLRTFCEREQIAPAVIKVDVEGGEAGVLVDDARPVIEKTRAVVLEVHEEPLRDLGVDAGEFLGRLESWGKRRIELERRAEFEGNYNVALVPA